MCVEIVVNPCNHKLFQNIAESRVQLRDRIKATDLILMFALNVTMDHFPMANNVLRYGQMLRREDGHALKKALRILD